jgi:signal transduction histidine kinase
MRERAEQMGGVLIIRSRRGEGTDIVVVLPYDEPLVKAS